MHRQTIATILFSTVAGLVMSSSARADLLVNPTFSSSNLTAAPDTTDYEGNFYDGSTTFPPSSISIGTFSFTIPTGTQVIGATISGTFGDVNIPVTALTDLYVDNGNIEVAECDQSGGNYPPCAVGTSNGLPATWTYTFTSADLTNLASELSGGSIDFTAVQNSPFGTVVVGDPVLDIQLTPEPASIFTFAGGLLAFAALRRRK